MNILNRTRDSGFPAAYADQVEKFDQAQVEAYYAEQVQLYLARGHSQKFAEHNADWDCRARFRNNAYAKAIMGLFNNAREGGSDFVVDHRKGKSDVP